jgi:LysR family hydrogen peroxide-inducible transcriptional activator
MQGWQGIVRLEWPRFFIGRKCKPFPSKPYLCDMTLQQLEYIIALDDERHFQRAADRCYVTQPTLSMQVQKLEENLGLVLFDRKASPIRPTAAGEEVLAHARKVLEEARALKQAARTHEGWQEGEYHLGILPTLAPYLLPRFLPAFMQAHPGIRLVVEELQTEAILDRLNQQQLDLGLLAGPVLGTEFRSMPLFFEPLLVYAAFDHPLAEAKELYAHQLDSEGIWLLKQGHCLRIQMLNLCQLGGNDNPRRFIFESGSIETLKTMVDKQGGYTLVPALSNDPDRPSLGVHVPFAQPCPARAIVLCTHHAFGRQGLLNALTQSIRNAVPPGFLHVEGKDIIGLHPQANLH